ARRTDQTQLRLGAVAAPEVRAHVADPVGKPQFKRFCAYPEEASEKIVIVGELRASAALHKLDEDGMDLLLKFLQVGDVFFLLGLEGVEDRLVATRRMDTTFHADLADQLLETEAG